MDPKLLELDIDRAPVAPAPELADEGRPLDLTDSPADPTCIECGNKAPVDDHGRCRACAEDRQPTVAQAEAQADFGDIAANAAANANAHLLADDANGRASLGVGFHNATGYVEALKRGVARQTLSEYTATLRQSYGHACSFEISGSTYTVTLDGASFTAPLMTVESGNGYEAETHTNDAAIEAFKAQAAARRQAANRAKARQGEDKELVIAPAPEVRVRHLTHGDVVAGAAAEGQGIGIHWAGEGPLTIARATELVVAAGLDPKYGPKAKDPKTQANLAVHLVAKEFGLEVRREKKKDLLKKDQAYDRRWFLSTPNQGAQAGDSAGTVAIVVSLVDGALKYDVEGEVSEKITEAYTDLCSREVLQAGHVTSWLGALIRDHLGGVKFAGLWYVPRETRHVGERLVETIAPVWGNKDEWSNPPLPIATGAQLARGIANGLAAEVNETVKEMDAQAADCKDGKLGDKARQTYLDKFHAHAERVKAFAKLLGAGLVAETRATVESAARKLNSETDLTGTAERFAAVWDEIEFDLNREAEANPANDIDSIEEEVREP